MDKAVVLDVFDFVGFHVCKHLLNKGFEVHGFYFEEFCDETHSEAKMMEIGRNANFNNHTYQEWESLIVEPEKKEHLFIFSIYDLFILYKDSILLQEAITRPIVQYIEKNQDCLKPVLLMPIQMYRIKQEKIFTPFVEQIKEIASNVQLFYLPTIYGPWQPSSSMFQQAILSEFQHREIHLSEREWTNDALFVDDAVTEMLELLESGKSGNYFLESETGDFWRQCASFLKLDAKLMANSQNPIKQSDHHIQRVAIKNFTPISHALTEQIEHTEHHNKQRR